ncbi:MAG: hypothetical protein V2A66_00805 [Pseudomonadota bacterium]
MSPFHKKQQPHAQIHLPTLDAPEALLLVEILERAVQAIWRTHGPSMADHLAASGVDTPKPEDAVWSGDHDALDDFEF